MLSPQNQPGASNFKNSSRMNGYYDAVADCRCEGGSSAESTLGSEALVLERLVARALGFLV